MLQKILMGAQICPSRIVSETSTFFEEPDIRAFFGLNETPHLDF